MLTKSLLVVAAMAVGASLPLLFAEIDATGWSVIIGAVALGVVQVLKMYLDYKDRKADREKAEQVAKEAKEAIKEAALESKTLAVTLGEVHKAVNSTTEALAREKKETADEVERDKKAKDDRILELTERLTRAESLMTKEKGGMEATAEMDPVAVPKIEALAEKVDDKIEALAEVVDEVKAAGDSGMNK